jgi:predicted metal-binding membrane protein
MWTKVDTRRPLIVTLVLLSALAWLALWWWGQSPYSRYLDHHHLEWVTANFALAPLFIVSWVVMTIAMMLPTSLPLIMLFNTLTHRRRDHTRLVVLLIGGYLAAWTLFGLVIYASDFLLHQIIGHVHELADRGWLFSSLALMLAGIYQFTPLKHFCLEKCRSPLSFITGHWHGNHEAQQAVLLGVHHGLFCVGCCWSLMLLMFAVGAGSLGWMLVLGTLMAVEKNVSWGEQIGQPLGLLLLVGGVAVLIVGTPS